jgi:hypothetical protein
MVNTIEYLVQVVVQYSIRGTFKVTQTSTYCTVWCTRQYHEILQFVTYRKSVSSYLLFPLQHKVLNYVYMCVHWTAPKCTYTELHPHVRTYTKLHPHVHTLNCIHMCVRTLNCIHMYTHWTAPPSMYTEHMPKFPVQNFFVSLNAKNYSSDEKNDCNF